MSHSGIDAARAAIEAAIPHRDPFLFLDRVVDEGEESLTSEWRVPADAPWFRGHYPGEPVTPGVLISEHVFQTAAVLISRRLGGFDPEQGIPVLTKIERARFRRIVRPGEQISTRVEVRERVGPAWFLSGRSSCDNMAVLQIEFVLSATAAIQRAGESV